MARAWPDKQSGEESANRAWSWQPDFNSPRAQPNQTSAQQSSCGHRPSEGTRHDGLAAPSQGASDVRQNSFDAKDRVCHASSISDESSAK